MLSGVCSDASHPSLVLLRFLPDPVWPGVCLRRGPHACVPSAKDTALTPASAAATLEPDPTAGCVSADGSAEDTAARLDGPAASPRQQLIVVASLLDKVPNLAGLARTCEIFRAQSLVLADTSIIKRDPLFAAVSMTAEHWVSMTQVTQVQLPGWLRGAQQEGYSLVGLEQTARSHNLHSFKFPARTVLVLGAEADGIPPDILSHLECTIEIPQLGVVRSLNVHVSGALAIHEYTRQHSFGTQQLPDS